MPGDHVKYIPPFEVLKRSLGLYTVNGELCVSITYNEFMRLLRLVLASTEVDEEWYLREYEDIRQAVEEGRVASGKQHFVTDGYFEGRVPFPMAVDEAWYLERYPDVVEGIRAGSTPSGQQHFVDNGYREGRLPEEI
jgi:hypothetical protein